MASRMIFNKLFQRNFSNSSICRASLNPDPVQLDKSLKLWKFICLYVTTPVLIATIAHVYINHEHEPRPEFIKYDYLRIRNKRLPWGDGTRTLFHNPKRNALPDGYEEDDDHH